MQALILTIKNVLEIYATIFARCAANTEEQILDPG
jgi:hypothetical protein